MRSTSEEDRWGRGFQKVSGGGGVGSFGGYIELKTA
jgi:hypothetical protein